MMEDDDLETNHHAVANFPQILIALFFTALLVKFVHSIICNLTSPVKKIPSPPGHFLLGHLPVMLRSDLSELYQYWINKFASNGMIRIDILIGPEKIVITRPKDVRKVLVLQHRKFRRPPHFVDALPMAKGGVFTAEGEEHDWQRKLLHPSFTKTNVKQFADLFIQQTSLLVKIWTEKIKDENNPPCTIVVENDINKCLLDIASKAAFGYDMKTLSDVRNENTKALTTLLSGCYGFKSMFVNRYFGFLGKYITLFGVADVANAKMVMDKLISEVILSKEEKLKCQKDSVNQTPSRPDILELMMNLTDGDTGRKMSRAVLKSNVMSFMIAGYDATSSCLTWTLYLLALHADKQDKARKEVISVSPKNTNITGESVDNMTYLECVLKESMRVYSPAQFVSRETVEPVTLGGVCIPVGYDILIPFCYIHKSEEFWKEAMEFIPERFDVNGGNLNEERKDIGLQFLPFSLGPTGCIGNKFALLEMKVIIALLLKNFTFRISPSHPKVQGKVVLTLRPVPSPEFEVELLA